MQKKKKNFKIKIVKLELQRLDVQRQTNEKDESPLNTADETMKYEKVRGCDSKSNYLSNAFHLIAGHGKIRMNTKNK